MIGEAPDPNTEQKLPNIPGRKRKDSEMPTRQLARAWVEVETPRGKRKRVLAALDSQSNATFISRTIGQSRDWDTGETSAVMGLGHAVHTEAAKTIIVTDHDKVELRGRFEPSGEFSDPDTHLLLGAKDCRELQIDLNHAIDNLVH